MGRAPCCDKANVKRGPWSPDEDATLRTYLHTHGTVGNWIALPRKAGLKRCGKSCRLRWLNYLRPDIKHGGFTEEEDNIICTLYLQMGSRWSAIASQLPGRTDNDVKNYWNTKLKKKLMAGKVSLKTMTNSVTLSSTPALQNQSCLPSSLPIATDASSGFIMNPESMSLDVIQLYSPWFKNVSGNNHLVSLSEEGSSISDSSSIAVDKQLHHLGDEATQVLMDLGFGLACDLVKGEYCEEKVGPSWYPELVDFSYGDIKADGVNKNV